MISDNQHLDLVLIQLLFIFHCCGCIRLIRHYSGLLFRVEIAEIIFAAIVDQESMKQEDIEVLNT